jgi:hypothetical protein
VTSFCVGRAKTNIGSLRLSPLRGENYYGNRLRKFGRANNAKSWRARANHKADGPFGAS